MIKTIERLQTKNGNKIQLLGKLSDKSSKNILFLGVTHGEEPQGKFLIENFIKKIETEKLNFKNNLYFIPCLNPDGMQKGQRGNSNNVDLNRNFPTQNYEVTTFDDGTTSGDYANSEMETQFLSKIIDSIKFDIILSFHAPFAIVNYDGGGEKIAQKISEITGYPVQADIGYPTPGSFGTFCGIERNIPIITLEVSDKLSNEKLWIQNEKVFVYLANL
ncbi:MAG: DUF2817 domain-containing protein [bacterium]|nr:DUF2817 domain-containing protein [bacterium]